MNVARDMLSVKNLNVSFRDEVLVDSVSLDITSGEITTLLGKSGSGKSLSILSFFDLLPQNLRASFEVFYNGKRLDSNILRKKYAGRLFSIVLQNPLSCFNPLFNVRSHFKESCFGGYDEDFAISLLESVGLDSEVLGLYPFELSGGMAQRVMFAICLVNSPKFLLLDEPTSDIDKYNEGKILALIESIKARGVGILLVTHDLDIALSISDSIYVMGRSKIVARLKNGEFRGFDGFNKGEIVEMMR